MEKINWGIIGLGKIANIFADSFKNVKNSNLIAIASNNRNRLKNFREKYSIENDFAFSNYEELLNCDKVDIVYIALPHSLHFKLLKDCISFNKNILVENPATISLSEIQEINRLLDKKKIFFAEAFMYLFHPQTDLLLKLINDDNIGELVELKTQFGFNIVKKNLFKYIKSLFFKENRLLNKDLGGGSLLDIGCYTTSFSLLLSNIRNNNDIEKIKITNKNLLFNNKDVDLEVSATLNFSNGFKSKILSSFRQNIDQVSIIKGSKGQIDVTNSWHCEPSKIICNGKKYGVENNNYKNAYSFEIEKVSKAILNGKFNPPYPAFNRFDTENNMKIIEKLINEKAL